MLPDFPELKKKLSDIATSTMKRSFYRETAFLSEVRQYHIHEGDRTSLHRPDGSIETREYKAVKVELEIPTKDLPTLSPQELRKRLDQTAAQMAQEVSEHAFARMREAIEKVGNVLDAAGRQVSPDILFEALEKIALDFHEEDESPHELTMVVGPKLGEALGVLIPQWRADPSFETRYRTILAKKREEWRVREARRKLVN